MNFPDPSDSRVADGTPAQPADTGATDRPPSRTWRTWIATVVLCVAPAALLAACALADDGVSSLSADATRSTDSVAGSTPASEVQASTDVATTAPVASDAATTTSGADATTTSAEPVDEPEAAAISFADDIEPIIVSTCANCHTGTGPGTQHVVMDTAGIVAKSSVGIEFVTRTGFMPPWPASDESVEFAHDWSLTDDEIALLGAWHEAGSPLDVAEDHVIAPDPDATARLEDPDVAVRSQGAYDGELGQDDEYRCLIYDPAFDGPGFVTAMDFVPDQEQVVHHAVGFLLSQEDRATLDEIDGADGQGGWTCFGFSPGRSARLIYAWAPGQAASRYPDGSGLHLDEGDFFVMQTHYHFDVEAPADQSTLALDWLPVDEAGDTDAVNVDVFVGPAEIPCSADETGPLCNRDAAVALAVERYGPGAFLADGILAICGKTPEDFAGFTDGYAESSCDQRVGSNGEIVSVFGHQHEVGASFRMTLHPDTPDEMVLLDIPDWDFDWQLNYEPADPIILQRGDVIRLECAWDRSRRDPTLEPAYIVWADGTDDEMCFASMVTRPT